MQAMLNTLKAISKQYQEQENQQHKTFNHNNAN
jgi:hypothetical protein